MAIDFSRLLQRINANARTPREYRTYQCTECRRTVEYDVRTDWEGTGHYRLGYPKPCKKGVLVRIGCRCDNCFLRWYVGRTFMDTNGVLRFEGTRLDVMHVGKTFERNGKLGELLKSHPKLSADDIVFAGHLYTKAVNA